MQLTAISNKDGKIEFENVTLDQGVVIVSLDRDQYEVSMTIWSVVKPT